MGHTRWPRRFLVALLATALVPSVQAKPHGRGSSGHATPTPTDLVSESLRAKLVTTAPQEPMEVILRFVRPTNAEDRTAVTLLGATSVRDLQIVPALAVRIPAYQVSALAQLAKVAWVGEDTQVAPSLDVAREAAGLPGPGAPPLRETGAGITVAVLDSGIAAHPDLAGRIAASVDMLAGGASVPPSDPYGHGTHVAGIVAGNGASSGGHYRGIAPGAQLVSVRVLDAAGAGRTSDVIAGLQWVRQNRAAYGIRVAVLSLGHPVQEPAALDPLVSAVEALESAGVVVVCSAGNYGRNGNFTVTSPGTSPSALTVGALTDWNTAHAGDDLVASYSSRGPTLFDHLAKPDLLAPGNRVVSLRVPGSVLDTQHPELRMDDGAGGQREPVAVGRTGGVGAMSRGEAHFPAPVDYFELSGTSMAAPMVAGTAALMLEARPGLTPDTVKARLMRSAGKAPGADPYARGAGRLDVAAALAASGTAGNARSPEVERGASAGTLTVAPPGRVWGSPQQWTVQALYGNAVWSDTSLWGDTVLWGDRVVSGDTALWGDTTVLGDHVQQGD
ncbi:MAG TPA: S8 family peptidase [Candidatus Polarisedimenticolaceae bacterium]|nr:S8 family peptidase [Candidatus Polarisedimenticolaceae bacterium]